MKTWKTAVRAMGCGYDITHRIAQGEAYLEIEDGAGRKRVRCSKCAVRHETHVVEEPAASEPAPIAEPEPEPALETEGDPW